MRSIRLSSLLFALLASAFQSPLGAQVPVAVIDGEREREPLIANPRRVLLIGDRLLLLDREAPFLHLYALDGSLVHATGRLGSGPGEYRSPQVAAYSTATRELSVLDPANGRITRYVLGDSLRYEGSAELEFHPEDACYMGRQLFVLAMLRDGLLHRFERRAGRLEKTGVFGSLAVVHPLAADPIFRSQATQGRLLCDSDGNRVIFSSRSANAALIVDVASNTQKSLTLANFTPLVFEAVPGGIRQGAPKGGKFDETVAIRRVPAGVEIIVGRADSLHEGSGDYAEFGLIPLSFSGVEGVRRRAAWQEVGARNDRVVCYRADPIPLVHIYRLAACPVGRTP